MGDLINGRKLPVFGFVSIATLVLIWGLTGSASAQGLPPGASPGAQQPQQDMRYRLRRLHSDLFPITPFI